MSDRPADADTVAALANLLMSHVCAMNLLVPGAAAETLGFLDTQIAAARRDGNHRRALLMEDLAAQLRQVCDLH